MAWCLNMFVMGVQANATVGMIYKRLGVSVMSRHMYVEIRDAWYRL